MRQHLLRQPAEFTAGIQVHDGPKTGNRRRLPRAHREPQRPQGSGRSDIWQAPEAMQPKIGRAKSRYKGDRQPKIRCRNRRKTVDSRKPGGRIEQGGNRSKTIDRRKPPQGGRPPKPGGQSRRKTIDSRNRSAETIDNRKSGRRELPETAAAWPLRRISRDGPRRRIPLQT